LFVVVATKEAPRGLFFSIDVDVEDAGAMLNARAILKASVAAT